MTRTSSTTGSYHLATLPRQLLIALVVFCLAYVALADESFVQHRFKLPKRLNIRHDDPVHAAYLSGFPGETKHAISVGIDADVPDWISSTPLAFATTPPSAASGEVEDAAKTSTKKNQEKINSLMLEMLAASGAGK